MSVRAWLVTVASEVTPIDVGAEQTVLHEVSRRFFGGGIVDVCNGIWGYPVWPDWPPVGEVMMDWNARGVAIVLDDQAANKNFPANALATRAFQLANRSPHWIAGDAVILKGITCHKSGSPEFEWQFLKSGCKCTYCRYVMTLAQLTSKRQ